MSLQINQISPAQWFKAEVARCKALLPKDYKMKLFALLPKEYDTPGGGLLVHNVLNGRASDMTVLEALKKLIGENV